MCAHSHFHTEGRALVLALVLALALIPLRPAGAQPVPLRLSDALELAVTLAPRVEARKASADGAAAARVAAGRLPDPSVSLGIQNLPVTGDDRFRLNEDLMTMRTIGVMQMVPNRASRAAQSAAADALTEREQALLAAERQLVRRQAAMAWLARHYAEKRLALFADLQHENRLLQQTVAAGVAAGNALPAEFTMARQEGLTLAARRDEMERERAQAQAALRRWIGPAAEAPLAGEPVLPPIDPAELRRHVAHHAELAVYEPMIRMAAAQAREAQAAKKPDMAWEVMYGRREPSFDDMVSVQVSIRLPLFQATRHDPRVLAKMKDVEQIEAQRAEALREHAQLIDSDLARLEELQRQLARLREQQQPLADERVQLLTASYAAGRADLGVVLAARRERVETRLKTLQTEGELDALRAQLSYLLGENITLAGDRRRAEERP